MQNALYSWGRYPDIAQEPHACHWQDDLAETLQGLVSEQGSTLAFGNGRSYGDSCLADSGHVLHMRRLDRFIAVDWQTGVLTAEAGVTLAEVLRLTIPQGWFLPVTPGTQFVTLGGAVANDVHGKNHHVRGTFGCHVKRFKLLRSDCAPQICSAEKNPRLFKATIGGLGLTGVIAWVELQLMPVRSSLMQTTSIRFDTLAQFFDLSRTYDEHYEYTVAWVDCAAKGAKLGRGIFMFGDHATVGDLTFNANAKLGVPLTPPVSLINPVTLRMFNFVYYNKHPVTPQHKLVSYEPFFYPLDGIQNWNRVYGKKGFQQYQCIIPEQQADVAVIELLDVISQMGSGSFLTVLKRCGTIVSPGLLSFPIPGVSLALDFPQHDRLNLKLFARMDAIVRQAGGRLYPAKDAHMRAEDFCHYYPNWSELETQRDPALCSRFWKRVTLL